MTDFVFLHGARQGGWVWEETVSALTLQAGEGFGRAIVLDVPGCGSKRDRDTSRMTVDTMASELATELTDLNVKAAVFVGHSQAGVLAPRIMAARPGMFRRVVYVACAAPRPGQSILAMMGSARRGRNADEVGWPLDPSAHPPEEQLALMFCNDMTVVQTETFIGKLGRDDWPQAVNYETDWRYDIASEVPATYVVCLRDGALPPVWQERFAQRLGAERMVRVDAGHQVMNTRPHALAETLRLEAAAA
jgi:pimeloyl-ACP methyl ester carboxylesterase